MKQIFTLLILVFVFFTSAMAQVITGTVMDGKFGAPLPGVTVKIKGTTISCQTDFDGNYTLKIDSTFKVIVFSFMSYETKEIEIKKQTKIDVTLKEADLGIKEVVTVGYAVQKKSDVTGAVSTFGEYDIITKAKVSALPATTKNASSTAFSAGTLTAGEINDFSKWILWNDKSQEELRAFDSDWHVAPSLRFSVMVQNQDGIAEIGQKVYLLSKNKDTVWKAVTDNVGKAELWANMYENKYSSKDKFKLCIEYNGEKYQINKAKPFSEGINHFTIKKHCETLNDVDIAFVVDATGSMGDEIEYLKTELNDVIGRMQQTDTNIKINTASVFYRDYDDLYVTQKSDLSGDVSKTVAFIKNQAADGGGDFPEAVDDALLVAVDSLRWSKSARTKILFLVLDAPPHQEDDNIKKLQIAISHAAAKGIKIVPITGSGIDKSTEYLMRSFALCTNGTYVFLTDDSHVGGSHITPTTDTFSVEKLNNLLLRVFTQFTATVSCDKKISIAKEKIKDTTTIGIKIKAIKDIAITDSSTKSTTGTATTKPSEPKEPIKISNNCTFYPNPTTGTVNLVIEGTIDEIYLNDFSGKILERYEVKGRSSFQIDISQYAMGVYTLSYWNAEDKLVSGRIILNQ